MKRLLSGCWFLGFAIFIPNITWADVVGVDVIAAISVGFFQQTCGIDEFISSTSFSCSVGTAPGPTASAAASLASGDLAGSGSASGSDSASGLAELADVLFFSGAGTGAVGTLAMTAGGPATGNTEAFEQIFWYALDNPSLNDGGQLLDFTFSGHPLSVTATIPLDAGPLAIEFVLQANAGALVGGAGSIAFTDPITITLPEGVHYTSESGVFLTAVPGPVPEPTTLSLLGLGLAGLGFATRRKKI